jgi:hypothetical protein
VRDQFFSSLLFFFPSSESSYLEVFLLLQGKGFDLVLSLLIDSEYGDILILMTAASA